ncbi:MAG: ABC transporter permease [Betaproteobacteria bacterium]|nr:ABC transporter permease [Betaproteobacteria bacterium]
MKETGVWTLAWRRFKRDRLGVASLVVVVIYAAVMLAAASGLIVRNWGDEAGVSFAPPTFLGPEQESQQLAASTDTQPVNDYGIADPLAPDLAGIAKNLSGTAAGSEARALTLPLGGDKWGRDVLRKAVKGTQTSLFIGLAAAALAVFIGTLFGALAGYRGGKVDDFFNWLYSVFTSIPYLLLVLSIAAVVNSKGVLPVILILGLTGWTGIFRLIRAEYMKHKVREYVMAADAIGASNSRRMFIHILPNVSHVVLVQLSLHVVLFIKSEVVLTFLGFGVGVDTVSWGSMLAEAGTELLLGKWWQLTAATVFMAVLVTAFSLFTDAMRDALDPRLK